MSLAAFPTDRPILTWLAQLPTECRVEMLEAIALEDLAEIEDKEVYDFRLFARAEQLPPPGDWRVWGMQAGRGSGKSRAAGAWVAEIAEANPGCRIGLLAPTAAKAREVMVEDSLFASVPPRLRPRDGTFYEPSKRRVNFANGTRAITYSADKPEQSRGANLHFAWAEEVGEWRDPEAWSNLDMALRKAARGGYRPRVAVSTTPTPSDLIREIFQGPKDDRGRRSPVTWTTLRPAMGTIPASFIARPQADTVVTRWSTYANRANLAADYIRRMEQRYAGSRLGRQELEAEILEDTPGALWNRDQLDKLRRMGMWPRLVRLVVSVDPSHASDGGGDACGIIAAGTDEAERGHVVRDDTVHGSPHEWGARAADVYDHLKADAIVYEDNDIPGRPGLVKGVIQAVNQIRAEKRKEPIRWIAIHSSRDKKTRADPVSVLYEQERVTHWVPEGEPDHLALLEDEMVSWDPTSRFSPNRLDALVHALSHLMIGGRTPIAAPQSVGPRKSNWRT